MLPGRAAAGIIGGGGPQDRAKHVTLTAAQKSPEHPDTLQHPEPEPRDPDTGTRAPEPDRGGGREPGRSAENRENDDALPER
ncbi:hypothetical protein Plo01_15940 [Planobispora longispora]|uniref:Uncharacterized protein n=1 Tax=Planobispora longispora TaxID=28887 RepID=A0A8J3RHZ5_9ACTN|nr:hypothetical protein GCM10020093_077760 [Planobispora longispora]GIH75165.1 hypothetical protein Plo01_15940 [Planobispora longispora]